VIGLTHFKIDLLDSSMSKRSKSCSKESPRYSPAPKLWGHRQIEHLARTGDFAPDEVSGDPALTLRDKAKAPG
jgi:hypothetical protein